jgi:DNA-binding MarR family transcriptional regulator
VKPETGRVRVLAGVVKGAVCDSGRSTVDEPYGRGDQQRREREERTAYSLRVTGSAPVADHGQARCGPRGAEDRVEPQCPVVVQRDERQTGRLLFAAYVMAASVQEDFRRGCWVTSEAATDRLESLGYDAVCLRAVQADLPHPGSVDDFDCAKVSQFAAERKRLPMLGDPDPKRFERGRRRVRNPPRCIGNAHGRPPSPKESRSNLLTYDLLHRISNSVLLNRDSKYTIKKSSISRGDAQAWTFLTNHAQVLLAVAQNPDIRLRDVAEDVGITERAAQRILTDLVEAGYVHRNRQGRRNHYRINPNAHMRHPAQEGIRIAGLLDYLQRNSPQETSGRPKQRRRSPGR